MGSSGKKQQAAPAAPPAPPPPPTQVEAQKAIRARNPRQTMAATTPENVRNEGGGRGLEVIPTTSRALKQLTGQ